MKFKRVTFFNKQVLHAEHLNLLSEGIAEYFVKLMQNKLSPGVIEISLDNLALTDGILAIRDLKAILSDFSYVDYSYSRDSYNLSFNLKEHLSDLVKPTKFYIDFNGFKTSEAKVMIEDNKKTPTAITSVSRSDIKTPIGTVTSVLYEEPLLKITNTETTTAIPFCEIIFNNGAFIKTSYEGPMLNFNSSALKKDFETSLLELKNLFLIEKDNLSNYKGEEFSSHLIYLKSISECISDMSFVVNNSKDPFEVFKTLTKCIGNLSWMSKNSSFYIPSFSKKDPSASIKTALSFLREIIKNYNTEYETVDIDVQNDYITFFFDGLRIEEVVIIVDPKTEETAHWIENTYIMSESKKPEVLQKRIIGIKRDVIDDGRDLLSVKLDLKSQYITSRERIFIQKSPFVNRVSVYFKRSK